jgi:hypothetical protein
LEEKLTRSEFSTKDKARINSAMSFSLATADAEGLPARAAEALEDQRRGHTLPR